MPWPRQPGRTPNWPIPVAHAGAPDRTRFVEHHSGQTAQVSNGALPPPELPRVQRSGVKKKKRGELKVNQPERGRVSRPSS